MLIIMLTEETGNNREGIRSRENLTERKVNEKISKGKLIVGNSANNVKRRNWM